MGQKVEPDDIEQGELGDCYLLSSLSVLAEQEDRVEALIDPERTRVDLGLFVARFCVGGHWRQVLVDDAFPCYAADAGGGGDDGLKGPIFSHSKGAPRRGAPIPQAPPSRRRPAGSRQQSEPSPPLRAAARYTAQGAGCGSSCSRRRGPRCSGRSRA